MVVFCLDYSMEHSLQCSAHPQEECKIGMKHLIIAPALLVIALATSVSASHPRTIPVKAAVVMDETGSVLFSQYPNARLAPASTVKLMTAMVVLDSLDPAFVVKISPKAARTKSIQPKLCADEEMTVSDLLHLALMASINPSAVALAEATAGSEQDFAVLMNKKALEIGAHNTLFANASGLPRAGRQYTTARDLILILKKALSYPVIKEILGKKTYIVKTAAGRDIFLENSDDLLWRSDATIIGKTGYTGDARHCFVCSINTDKGSFYAAVLGARSRSSLWKSTLALAEIGLNPGLAAISEKPITARKARRKTIISDAPLQAMQDAGFDAVKFNLGYAPLLRKKIHSN